ncbi:MAG: hypothetical protein AB8H80_06305 [Planctomycetota bacterium]
MTKNLSDELQRNARQALASLAPASAGEEPGGMPVRRLLAAFFRARYLVFGTTLFGVLIGMFMAITKANNYVSTGQFAFAASGAETRQVDPTQAKETSQEAIATSAAYILSSDDLLRRVIERLGPERILQPYQPGGAGYSSAKDLFFKIQRDWNAVDPAAMTPDEALKHLQKTIAVERPRFTNVLVARCEANDPALAQEILTTFMTEAVKWHIEKYDDQNAYEAAKAAYEASDVQMQAVQRSMRDFLDRKANVPEFDQHLQAVQLGEIASNSRVTNLQDDIKVKRSQLQKLDGLLANSEKLPPTKVRMVRQSISSELVTELRTQLANAHIRLKELERQYVNQEASEIKAQKDRIVSIESSIADVTSAEESTTMVDEIYDNPLYLDTVEERNRLERDLWGLDAQIEQAKKLHAEKETELKRLLLLEPEYEELRAAIVGAESSKKATQVNWEIAQQKRALGLGNFSSLKPIQEASVPLEKEGPNRGKLLIGGLFVGLFLGLGLVVLRALPDRVVRTRDDMEDIDGLAVIGVMPRLDRTNLRRHMSMREQGW